MNGTGKRPAGRSRTAVFSILVRDLMRSRNEVVFTRPGTRVADVIGELAARQAVCAIVVDAANRPLGIVTEHDVARRIAFKVPPETAIERIMTSPVMTINRRDFLYQAIAWMRHANLSCLPVIDRTGALSGIIELTDALEVAAERLMGQIDRISHEGTVETLREVKAAQVELAEELFADDLPAPEVQQVLTRINNDMYRRIGEATLKQMAAEGWGELPVTAATIVMGSGGRGENFLFPDQDNGFIISDYGDADHARIDTFFLELAERMCRDLNDMGIPYCNGYCMAVNPLWRKTLSQWIEQITLWRRKSNFVAIRLADIFFDFQPVWGAPELAHELRRTVTSLVRGNRFFLRQMFQEKIDHNVALGFFGGFITEKENREFRGQINLKYTGTIPLVGAIRLLALRDGVEETSTLRRIQGLAQQGVLSATEQDDLSLAFHCLTELLLRKQIDDYRSGRRVSYYIDPEALSKRDRAMLQQSLRSIDGIRKRVHLEFTGEIF